MNENLEENIQKEFSTFNIDEATKESITSDECFNFIFGFKNYNTINELVEQARVKAIDFNCEPKFNKKYKIFRDRYIKSLKSKGGFETNFNFDEEHDFKYSMQLKCGKWTANQIEGVYKNEISKTLTDMKVEKNYASTIPIFIAERIFNIDENIEKVRIAFYKDQKWQTIITEKNTICTKTKILQLANLGIEVNEINAKNLIEYFADLLELNEYPPIKGITHLGWINSEFVPYTDKYSFDGGNSFKSIYEGVKQKGDYTKWKKYIKELKDRSKTVRFMLSVSFASVLVKIFNINSFIVHLWGTSGKGKTVTQMICGSVWGNPVKNKMLVSLDNSRVASERTLNFLNNLPFIPDELQTIKNIYKNDYSSMIYSFTEGRGKGRGTVDGGIDKGTEWDNISILSGEEPITANISAEGVKNRVIEIEDNSDIIEDGNETVNFIKENYGWAGKDFIEILQGMKKEELYELRNNYVSELNKITKYKKQSNAMSVILVADYIASKYIFNEEPLTVEDIKEYIRNDTDEADRVIEIILNIAESNINNFRDYSNPNHQVMGQVWGELDRAKDGYNGTIFYYNFIPNVLYEELQKRNIIWNAVKKKLADKGYIKRQRNGEYTIPIKSVGGQQRFIQVKNIHNETEKTE